MDKLKTRILLISLLLVLLLSLQGVSAVTSDNGSLTGGSIDLSIYDNECDVNSDKPSNNHDNTLSASNELDVLCAGEGTYSQLNDEITNGGNTVELQHDYYIYDGSTSTIDITGDNRVIDGRGAIIDMAGSTIRAFNVVGSGVTFKNLTIKNANVNGDGGAIYFSSSGTLTNCNFNNNMASGNGGAVYFESDGNVTNCNFMNNSAYNGGAIYFNGNINNVTVLGFFKGNNAERAGGAIYVQGKSINNNFSSQFYDNNARQASGGAIFFYSLAENNNFESIFMNNYALYGGGIFFYKNANDNKFDSSFTFNVAKSCGGAIFFYSTTNNNTFTGYFINNSALGKVDETVGNGGAITFKDVSTNSIFTCEFINNTAALNGGGVNYRQTPHNITFNCNFIANNAPTGGGVNFFERFENIIFNGDFINNSAINGGAIAAGAGTIKEVSFKNNHAENGGAIYFANAGEIIKCNFIDNTATKKGGAILFNISGNVTNCNFNGNNATTGSAIYFDDFSGNNSISNSIFLNNRANAEDLQVTKNNNNITITFTGKDNLLNAIYSERDVSFTNVTYWGANGIANTGSSSITPSRSNREAGQNITVLVVVNGVLVLNEVKVTDENGEIVLDISAGENYFISTRHDTDTYYTEAEKTISNNNDTEPNSNNAVENKTAGHASTKAVGDNPTGNPMAIFALALFALVVTYRKKIKL